MKSRRGLSTVVGTVFAIIALATVITYVTYSMNTLQQFNQEVMVKNTELIDQGKEEFVISKAELANNQQFNITVQNTGTLPIKITRLYIENKTDGGAYKYDINKDVPTGGLATKIGQNIGFIVDNTRSYEIKLVSERGNTKEVLMGQANAEPLDLQLHVIPSKVPSDFTTTVILAVTNNMSSKTTLLNIVPTISESGSATVTKLTPDPIPPKYGSLASGDTAFFKWNYKVTGTASQSKTFTASLNPSFPGNTASDTVTLADVSFSIQSGTSVQSTGLTTAKTPDNILILHQETQDALTGRQMYSGAGDNAITFNSSSTPTLTFFTKNDTQQNVIVDPGKWNATLRIVSNAVPDGLNAPDIIYHFEDSGSSVTDSSGNSRTMTVIGGASNSGSNGRDSTKAYLFDGISQYLDGPTPLTSADNIRGPNDVTAAWFKYTGTQNSNKKVIYRVGSDNTDYYEIAIGDGTAPNAGKLIFRFNTASGQVPPSPTGNCVQNSGRVDDGNWHHFVAFRDGSYTCRLYIDGNNPTGTEIDLSVCSSGCGATNADWVEPVGKANIARNPANNLDFFKGYIDDFFHWNSYSGGFPQNKVVILRDTNYGANAHKFDFKFERVKADGSNPQNIQTNTNYPVKFWDGKGSSTAWSGLDINYTTPSLPSWTFAKINDVDYGDRLKFTMTWKSGLNMSLRIDDPGLTNPITSFISVPKVSEAFPSYYTYSRATNPLLSIYNGGPYGSWITCLTRAVFDDISSTNSYAGALWYAGTVETCNKNRPFSNDSTLIKVGGTAQLKFNCPMLSPDSFAGQVTSCPSGTAPPLGQYRLYVFLSGYDETGNIFLRTTYIGLVRVVA